MTGMTKPSGIPWIGEIPVDWETARTKYLCDKIFAGGTPDTNNLEYWENGIIPWLPSGMLQNCIINQADDFITPLGLKESSAKMIPLDTTLIAMTGATCANVGYLTFDSAANQSVTAFLRNKRLFSKFLFYTLQAARDEILLSQTGGAQAGINVFDCKNITVPICVFAEQKSIADFLDEECGKIDGIIADMENQVEILKAYKKAVIAESVTIGLPSGRTTTWIKNKLKYVAKIAPSVVKRGLTADSEVTFLPMECIRNGYFTPNTATLSELNSSYNTFKNGDILIAKVTPCFENGNIVIAENLVNDFGYGTSEIFVIRANKGISNRFLFYALQEDKFKCHAVSEMTGTAGLKRVPASFIENYLLDIPEESEQEVIAGYLDEECAKIEAIIKDKQSAVDAMREYKKSLIYEYVTGKKRVREAQ